MSMKYIKNIDPLNKKEIWLDGDTIEFALPENKVDLSSFKVFFDVSIDPYVRYNNNSYLKRFMPRLAHSIIQELTITDGNGAVIQDIKEFNLLYNILNDAIKTEDEMYSDKPDTITASLIDEFNNVFVYSDFTDSPIPIVVPPLEYSFFIKDFIGLISESTKSIIDCKKHKLKISIKLAPKEITYRGLRVNMATAEVANTINTNYHYKLSNVTANIDIVPENTPSGGKVIFKDYKHIAGNILENKNTSLKYKHKGNLSYVFGTFTDVNRFTDTGLQLQFCNDDVVDGDFKFGEQLVSVYNNVIDVPRFSTEDASVKDILSRNIPHALNNSIYFKRSGLNIKSSQFVFNGQNMTPQMNIPQIFLTAKEFFNNGMNRIKSLVQFQNDFFIFPIQVNQTDEDFVSEIEWNVESGLNIPNGGTPHLFICYDKIVEL